MIRVSTTFVVEIDPQTPAIAHGLRGRIEHVLSGAHHDFGSSAMLLQFIASALAGTAAGAGHVSHGTDRKHERTTSRRGRES